MYFQNILSKNQSREATIISEILKDQIEEKGQQQQQHDSKIKISEELKSAIPRICDRMGYSCTRCGNTYTRTHSLNRHVNFECGIEPKFSCPICFKKSKHKHNLLIHMRTHKK